MLPSVSLTNSHPPPYLKAALVRLHSIVAQRRSLKGALVRLSTGPRYHEGSAALARAAAKEFGRQPWIEGRGDSGVKRVREGGAGGRDDEGSKRLWVGSELGGTLLLYLPFVVIMPRGTV